MSTATGQNTTPIYSATPHIDSSNNNNSGTVLGPSASTSQTGGEATNIYQVFIAGTNGSYVQKIRFRSVVSPAATVARIFLCLNGTGAFTAGTTNTTTNTFLYDEISLVSVTLSQTVSSPLFEVAMNIALPANYRILVSFGTSTGSAGTGYTVGVIGGNY